MLEILYKRKHLPFRKITDKTIIVHTHEDKVITLDDVGTVLWETLENEAKLDDLYQTIENNFSQASHESVRDDVEDFLKNLLELKLIEARGE